MTAGSQTTPAPDMPRTCALCGNQILTSRQAFQHHVDDLTHTHYAWHITCKREETMSDTETEPTTPAPADPEPTDPEPGTDDQDDDEDE